MSTELLRASEAARRLEISTKELLSLVYGREIRYDMVDGIDTFPAMHSRSTEPSLPDHGAAAPRSVCPALGVVGLVRLRSEPGSN
jgi:hypothetical protein